MNLKKHSSRGSPGNKEDLDNWNKYYSELVKFFKEFGHTHIPFPYLKNPSLVQWALRQRLLYSRGLLAKPYIKLLEDLGFVWSIEEDRWLASYYLIVAFKKGYGHCFLPPSSELKTLRNWVAAQKRFNHIKQLGINRLRLLINLGILPNEKGETDWDFWFQRLIEYREVHCDCNVDSSKHFTLAHWLASNKQALKLNKLPPEYKSKLLALFKQPITKANSFQVDQEWQLHLNQLITVKEKYGFLRLDHLTADKQSLRRWISAQRKAYRDGTLSKLQIETLERTGFIWDAKDALEQLRKIKWHEKYNALVEFKVHHGNLNVPRSSTLRNWMSMQRYSYKRKSLSSHKIAKLNKLGMVWNVEDTKWNRSYNKLLLFYRTHGHCKVPRNKEHAQLSLWVYHQKKKFRKGKLLKDQIEQLSKLNLFMEDHIVDPWECNYNELIKFRDRYGHCDVPITWKNKKLANWVQRMRQNYKQGILSLDQTKRLETIGFNWVKRIPWEIRFGELKQFKQRYGHVNVTPNLSANKGLLGWVATQRAYYREGKLSVDRIKLLESLGFKFRSARKHQ